MPRHPASELQYLIGNGELNHPAVRAAALRAKSMFENGYVWQGIARKLNVRSTDVKRIVAHHFPGDYPYKLKHGRPTYPRVPVYIKAQEQEAYFARVRYAREPTYEERAEMEGW